MVINPKETPALDEFLNDIISLGGITRIELKYLEGQAVVIGDIGGISYFLVRGDEQIREHYKRLGRELEKRAIPKNGILIACHKYSGNESDYRGITRELQIIESTEYGMKFLIR
tara:strand:+ start:747 stop:1088 length:342 start_codon:yes stop_codon:yes gene_type:complete